MNLSALCAVLICLLHAATAMAQPPRLDPARVKVPSQFYTNGTQVDAWNRDNAREQVVTLWFGKNPKSSLNFRQLIAIRRDSELNKIYYYDLVARKFVGRYDMEKEGYSLLRPEHRLGRLEDIREDWFPEATDPPAIGDLFDRPTVGVPNDEQLMMPPVTINFPRLQRSEWEGFYTDIGANRRRKVKLKFDRGEGEFEAPDVEVEGRLRNVTYHTRDDMQVIRGDWKAGGTQGGFEFRIAMSNLNEFQGEYWVANDARRVFLWDGKRTSR